MKKQRKKGKVEGKGEGKKGGNKKKMVKMNITVTLKKEQIA